MKPSLRFLNEGDLNEVTCIHLKAFPGRALSLLGAEGVQRYYAWQLNGPHEAVALGVFLDEKLVGFCFGGVFHGALSGFLKQNKKYLTWQVLTHPWLAANPLFRQRLNLAQTILGGQKSTQPTQPVSQPKSFGILAIAVDPEFQGQGYGKELSKAAEAIALERGFSRMHLTVDIDNVQAISFYECSGWEKRLKDDAAWTGQMTKDLSKLDG